MMMPSLTSSSSSSSSSAAMRVEKATSEFLIGPDWTMNIDICDAINNNHWLAKDIIKALKKRLQHKNPKVQLLALTLLETMVKNCGDLVHSQIAERNILQEMIKIVKKKTDMHVRDKILILLDSWQEAFGGPGGRYPQYYWTYEELRRSGLNFPQRSSNSAPIFTPPATHPSLSHTQASYGMPSNSSTRLDEVMAAEIANLSLASISSMQNVLDLLADMLQAINPSDREAVKDEVIVDLVEQCRTNQKKLMQMLTTTTSEELLAKGLELNDSLQIVLAKRDAIASGSPLLITATSVGTQLMRANEPTEVVKNGGALAAKPSAPVGWKQGKDEEEEEDDDFAQLARRHGKIRSGASGSVSEGTDDGDTTVNTSNSSCTSASLPPVMGNELALPDPPVSVKTTKEQDIIELLSLTLSTTNNSPHTQTHEASAQYMNLPSASPTTQGYSTSYSYPGNNAQALSNSYVVPWAQPQPQPQTMAQPQYLPHQPQPQYPGNLSDTQTLPQSQPQLQIQMHPQTMAQPQYLPQSQLPHQAQPQYPSNSSGTQFLPPSQSQPQPQPQNQLHHHSHPQPQYPQYSSGYPPPPWVVTPRYLHNSNSVSPTPYTFSSTQQASTSRPLKNVRPNAGGGQRPFVPSYRLFEDLNVLGNTDARYKTSSTSPSLSGVNNPSMVGGRK